MASELEKLISKALIIENEDAKEAGELGFMARGLVQATMPHRKLDITHHRRVNGDYTLNMVALDEKIGLPYGSMPRLILAWLATEAVKKKEREITLGDSMSDFMRSLDIIPTGGRWGSITTLKEQTKRLFSTAISCSYTTKERMALANFTIGTADFWWDVGNPEQLGMFKSKVVLSEGFYNELINNPIPIDIRALKALKRSPLGLDLYCWLTYRMSYLHKPTLVDWSALRNQFGSNYADTKSGRQGFKKAFDREMKKVLTIYPELNVVREKEGIKLKKSRTHIKKL